MSIEIWQDLLALVRDYDASKGQTSVFTDDIAFINHIIKDGYSLSYNAPSSEKDMAKIVLGYLNEKARTKYLAVNQAGKLSAGGRLVISRILEGFSIEDLKMVIDRKCAQWLNTPEEKWLRPETLFNRTKFESYYGAKQSNAPSGGIGQLAGSVEAAKRRLLGPRQD